MKLIHLSDLHIGRQLNGYSLKESQEAVFSQIAEYVSQIKPDAILICGDIYDRAVPAADAYTVFERFLNQLKAAGGQARILVIAGNHDSPERLAYSSSFLKKHGIIISVFPPSGENEYLEKVTLEDAWGPVHFYLFPFIRPGHVRHLFAESKVTGYENAFRGVLGREQIDESQRNVILAHQFFTAKGKEVQLCDSETAVAMAGGLDQIDVSALAAFDYAALGHLHGPQRMGEERFRYCGTPYKYSVSEEHHRKSVTLVTLEEKGKPPVIETLPLTCEPEVRRLRGTLEELKELSLKGFSHDYVSLTLTDENEVFDFREQLEECYERILEIRIDNTRTRARMEFEEEAFETLSPLEAFRSFYQSVRKCPMTAKQEEIMAQIVEEAGEELQR